MKSGTQSQVTLSNATVHTNTHANKQLIYLLLIGVSIVVSWGIFAQFLFTDHASVERFFEEAFASPIATLLSSDILLSALIFLIFARIELKRLGMPNRQLVVYTIATFSVGVCCGLSLFLYQRETWLIQQQGRIDRR